MKLQAFIIGLGLTLAVGARVRRRRGDPFGAGACSAVDDGEQSRENDAVRIGPRRPSTRSSGGAPSTGSSASSR